MFKGKVDFRLSRGAGAPIHQQMLKRAKEAIASGALQPGEKIETIKEMAIWLKVNPNTVARVYRELEREGLISTQGTLGSYISLDASLPLRERERTLRELLDTLLDAAERMQTNDEELFRLFRERVNARKTERKES